MTTDKKIVIFGEVLFDDFGDKSMLGGAPFNVAWHLQGFGLNPLIISRIGQDTRGKEIQNRMKKWGMSRRGLQIDQTHPTGVVSVQTNAGEPHFTIQPDQAYDYINENETKNIVPVDCGFILYHGTLALRDRNSRSALRALTADKKVHVFLDVNLRKPWWSKATLVESMDRATWLKCNTDELNIIASIIQLTEQSEEKIAFALSKKYNLDKIFVTKGSEGAIIICGNDNIYNVQPAPVAQLVDTVGAGDAFSAVSIFGILSGWQDKLILGRAVDFAARICQIQGAITDKENVYLKLKESWS